MHLFISPHFDDAALSCGGLIHQLTQSGQAVTILTMMAAQPPDPLPDSPLVRELHQRWEAGSSPVTVRRQEDEAAAQILGARVQFMDIPDCVYRMMDDVPLYPNGDEDIFGPVHPDDPAKKILESTPIPHLGKGTRVYAPLGAGNHVDHQLARMWALDHRNAAAEMLFYEEYPYSGDEAALQPALDAFPANLAPEIVALDQSNYEAKCAAIAAHRSQISTFWDTIEQMRVRVAGYMRRIGNGKLAERYWRIMDV